MALEELQNGRYHRLRLLGSGGMGEVYLMEDERVSRQVAIKVTRSEIDSYPDSAAARDAARLFQREARAIAALEHPNILPLYDFGEETLDGTTITYMVMPFCIDGSLAGWFYQRSNTNPLSLQDIAHLVEQAAEALQYAHDHQVIHLDVKPSNFLIRRNSKHPNRPTLLLADFGLARSSTTTSSSSRTIRGTPTSMAPEQWSSRPVAATDQYGLAVMTYEMLAGRPPFVGSMEQLMYQHFSVQPDAPSTYNPQIPAAIDAVLLRALSKKPDDRFPSIAAFAEAFAQAVNATSDRMILVEAQQPTISDIANAVSDAETIGTASEGKGISADPISAAPTLPASKPEIKQSFDSVVDHNMPTLAAADTSAPVLDRQSQPSFPSPTKRQPASFARTIGIISGILVVLLVAGTVFYFTYSGRQPSSNANSIVTGQSQTATAVAQAATHATTVTVSATPTPQNGLYIAGTYNGSMNNQVTNQTTNITVFIRQTRGMGTLNGSVTFKTQPPQTDLLSGTDDLQGNFSFTTQASSGQKPFYFYGTVQNNAQGIFLHGNFCNSSTNTCDVNLGFFNVGPGY
jgi:serine/threonine protein kinase